MLVAPEKDPHLGWAWPARSARVSSRAALTGHVTEGGPGRNWELFLPLAFTWVTDSGMLVLATAKRVLVQCLTRNTAGSQRGLGWGLLPGNSVQRWKNA